MLQIETLVVGAVSTNCYLVSDGETLDAAIVDPGGGAERILSRIRANGLNVRYVFLTHGHFDHILALEEVRPGAAVVIHEKDAAYLRDRSLSAPFRGLSAPVTDADILARDGDAFRLGRYTVEVLHTPGHTPGSVCLRIPEAGGGREGVLFTGDTLFEDDCGRCDLPGGDYAAMLRSLRRLAALPGDYAVYPGHDVATTLQRERERNANMLEAASRA
ncbi:MAG: MBL fold metallo-hydrolase [Oscillospiraceae bacterium]|jgi:glyoxylase-like metal-dependent hydrolase (beta-lactamase superfamily II)|nr:MBL fold metallo-hydrolase [Oscillospiraceae bacterium]